VFLLNVGNLTGLHDVVRHINLDRFETFKSHTVLSS
jgi:hypothetical protein